MSDVVLVFLGSKADHKAMLLIGHTRYIHLAKFTRQSSHYSQAYAVIARRYDGAEQSALVSEKICIPWRGPRKPRTS